MNRSTAWLLALLAVIGVRLATLSAYPLHDTTEARYSEIARIMASTNEWLVPQIAPGTTFWAKPPLSIWATAASIKLLGPTEFAARLSAVLFSLASLTIIVMFSARRYSTTAGWAAGTIFVSSGIGFIGAGAVMTDAALTLAMTIGIVSFTEHIKRPTGLSAYGFFVGLALGLLAKGPVALVLIGLPVAIWSLWSRGLKWLWHTLPWLKGLALVCALTVPWYAAAERHSPGFLEYFLVGEHFYRFVDSGWTGDLYGSAHERPRGTIWLFGLAGLLPWSILGLYAVLRRVRANTANGAGVDEARFLILAFLSPLVLFTFAGNILPAYVMPVLPSLSLLLGKWLRKRAPAFAGLGLVVPLMVTALFSTGLHKEFDHKSQKGMLNTLASEYDGERVYYFERMPYSASFYSDGSSALVRDNQELTSILAGTRTGTLLVRTSREPSLENAALSCLKLRGMRDGYTIFSMANCGTR